MLAENIRQVAWHAPRAPVSSKLDIGIGESILWEKICSGLCWYCDSRYFILFTNVQIDIGFVMANLVPMILVLIFTEQHLRAAWRLALGLGVLPPLSLFYLRLKLKEPEEFNRETMKDTQTPWWLVIKWVHISGRLAPTDQTRFYWFRLTIVSLIWFIYDFSAYSFSIYSSAWLALILGKTAPLWKTFGWNTLINVFYLPGAIGGAFLSDWIGPRHALAIGVFLQGLVGFLMAGLYSKLNTPAHVGGFVVVYGFDFSSFIQIHADEI